MKMNADLSDHEIKAKLKKMNRHSFIIQLIILGVLMLISFYGYLYIWCMGPFRDIIPNVNAVQAAAIHMSCVISVTLFIGDILIYAAFEKPIFFGVYKYDLKYGKYSKRKGE